MTNVLEQVCPYCGHKMDRVTDPTGNYKPKPGDLTICFKCLEVANFNKNMKLEKHDFSNTGLIEMLEIKRIKDAIRSQR